MLCTFLAQFEVIYSENAAKCSSVYIIQKTGVCRGLLQADRKVTQQNLIPARQLFPKRHKINIFIKPNKLTPPQRIKSSFAPLKCELSMIKIVSALLVTSCSDTSFIFDDNNALSGTGVKTLSSNPIHTALPRGEILQTYCFSKPIKRCLQLSRENF